MTLLNKIKKTITKYRKWIFPVGLGAILSLFLLGRRNKKTSSYDDLKKRQEDREEKAEHIIGIADDIEKETEQLINEFYKRRFERRD